MSVTIVVPARYDSSRYPGKPLAILEGATGKKQSLIERSWRAACAVKSADKVFVATDDERIADACLKFGADVVMTTSDCRNGTERCAEALDRIEEVPEILVNLQGDAPLTPSWFVDDLVAGLKEDSKVALATPVLRCDGAALSGFKQDRRADRVGGTTAVFDYRMHALYFSKEVIPFTSENYGATDQTPVFHHVGVYAYRPETLSLYPEWPVGPLEELEGLEQLRFLENGHKVLCVEVDARRQQFWELNNPEDIEKLERMMREMGME